MYERKGKLKHWMENLVNVYRDHARVAQAEQSVPNREDAGVADGGRSANDLRPTPAMDNIVTDANTAARSFIVLPEGGVDLATVELNFIKQALERTSGVQTRAARLLGISRYAMRSRMKKHGLL